MMDTLTGTSRFDGERRVRSPRYSADTETGVELLGYLPDTPVDQRDYRPGARFQNFYLNGNCFPVGAVLQNSAGKHYVVNARPVKRRGIVIGRVVVLHEMTDREWQRIEIDKRWFRSES